MGQKNGVESEYSITQSHRSFMFITLIFSHNIFGHACVNTFDPFIQELHEQREWECKNACK